MAQVSAAHSIGDAKAERQLSPTPPGRSKGAGKAQSGVSWAPTFQAAWHVWWPKLRRSTSPSLPTLSSLPAPCARQAVTASLGLFGILNPTLAMLLTAPYRGLGLDPRMHTRSHKHTRIRDGAEVRRRCQRLHRAGSTPLHKNRTNISARTAQSESQLISCDKALLALFGVSYFVIRAAPRF